MNKNDQLINRGVGCFFFIDTSIKGGGRTHEPCVPTCINVVDFGRFRKKQVFFVDFDLLDCTYFRKMCIF